MMRQAGLRARVCACAVGVLAMGGITLAQEVKRTELDRSPVSGDDTREIVTQLVEFPPGATSPRHFHNGEESFYVIAGGTVQMPGKEPKERPVGEHGINQRGVPHAGYTVVGDRTIKILSVYVVDKGKPLQESAPIRSAQDAARAELAPTGSLRVGLVEAPSAGLIFVRRSEDGTADGVTADLSGDLARKLGVPLVVTLFPNTGAAAAALQAGTIDVSFMPVDATRRQVLEFGPGYYDLESTYLASGASGITDVAQVDRPGIRVVAIDGTSTIRASARTLKQTQPVAVPSVAEAVERMRTGQADAFALSRDTLQPIMAQVPGSRIVSGGFQQTQVAVALPKGRPAALTYVTAWMNEAKGAGLVRRVFDSRGFTGDAVAP